MDTYKEEFEEYEVIADGQPEQPAEAAPTELPVEEIPAEQTPVESTEEATEDGCYRGVGTGTRETTFTMEDSATASRAEPVMAPERPKRRRRAKGLGRKILKISVASVLTVALVAAACGISIVVTNTHWQGYTQLLQQNFEDQIRILRQELDEARQGQASHTTIPTNGLTPSQIYAKNIRSVVAINCVIRRTQENGQVQEGISAGSGFVFSKDGHIVTNYHVVEGSSAISVTFADGRQLQAAYIGGDAVHDIALLKVEATGLMPVTIGVSSALQVGDQVVAIGNALGELSFSLTVGYVSGIDRAIATDGSITNMIQTDASINSGNSGGPLFNGRGEVIGITTAKYSGVSSSGASIEGVGFALPMDDVIGMLQDLRQFGYITGAYMGIMVQDVDPAAAEMYGFPLGAYVRETTPGHAAQRAGLRPKDIITNVGGYEITCMSDLTRALRNFQAGDETTIVVWRGGQWMVLKIVFEEKPH